MRHLIFTLILAVALAGCVAQKQTETASEATERTEATARTSEAEKVTIYDTIRKIDSVTFTRVREVERLTERATEADTQTETATEATERTTDPPRDLLTWSDKGFILVLVLGLAVVLQMLKR